MLLINSRNFFLLALLAFSTFSFAQSTRTATLTGQDFIVAVVDSIPITNHDVTLRAPQLRDQLKQQGRHVPDGQALLKAALERLIVEKALLQHAKETGLSVEEEAVNQAEQRLAAQSQLSLAALHQKSPS